MSSANQGRSQQAQRSRRVLVVGAGFAGLACGYELSNSGCNVHVLEARSRIGGRVDSRTDLIPGKVVEAGGEFLGANHPTALRYIQKFGLRLLDAGDKRAEHPQPVVLNRHRLSESEIDAVDAETATAFGLLTELARTIDPQRPWSGAQAASLDHTSLGDWLSTVDLSPLAKWIVEAYFTSTNSVSIHHQSLLGNLAQIHGGGLERYWTETEAFRLEGGNQQLAIKLADAIGQERIQLNAPVARIQVLSDRVIVTEASSARHVVDEVVLTVPPSLWSRIRIEPAIPSALHPQIGAAVKFLSVVNGRFWTQHGLPPAAFVFSNQSPAADVGELWWGTEHQSGSSQEAMVGFVAGPAADYWIGQSTDSRNQAYARQLQAVQPGFAAAVEEMQFIDWVNDPWSRGSYSFPAPGQITSQGPLLHNGLGRLRFAGEHACYPFVGYMEGALSSGASVAKRIVVE